VETITLFWHRRDLRINDNVGLFYALSQNKNTIPLFIFDNTILEQLEDKFDPRVSFIHEQVLALKAAYENAGGSLLIKHGNPIDVFKELSTEFTIEKVYTNNDYEPYALQRDAEVKSILNAQHTSFHSYKDHVVFEKDEVLKKDGTPYTIYTPYMKVWKEKFSKESIQEYPSESKLSNLFRTKPFASITLNEIGFKKSSVHIPSSRISEKLIVTYDETRNFPAIDGTSRLGIHFRFGTISIRQKVKRAASLNETFLNELIWREFYQMIIYHFPYSAKDSFKKKYDGIRWLNDEKQFELWCKGETGYPIVDAGMRELNTTGHMHNRVRMIVASFLTKHLLIDWRWGEAYFASKLLDYELASNVGGWQWAAGCGCDAAPYFRVFSPSLQANKFDASSVYVNKWVPEILAGNYTKPIVDHAFARNRAIATYKKALL
jgi:deoxyribodipyrimidine photo-lyase